MATVDNSTQVVTSTESGTGWSVDVEDANLDPLLTLKDFIVKFDNIVQSNVDFTKTSVTIITYNGVAIGSTTVTVERDTPNERVKCLTFGDRLQSAEYEAEFNRVHKLINENELSQDVRVTLADTTPGTLEDKIVEGADVLLSVLNPGANEQLQISVSSPTSEPYVDINSAGLVPSAIGNDAIAIGEAAVADGISSVVIGINALTDNADFATDECVVIGSGATVDPTPTTGSDSSFALALGVLSTVRDSTHAVAMGSSSLVDDAASGVAIGRLSRCTADQGVAIGEDSRAVTAQSVAIGRDARSNNACGISIGRNVICNGNNSVVIGPESFTNNAEFSTGACVVIGSAARVDPTPTTGAASDNSIAIGNSAIVADATNAVQLGTGTNSTDSTLQFLGNTLADVNGLVNHLVNQDITSGVDITVTPGVSNDRLFVTPTANINLILLTAGAVNTTHFTFVNLDPGTFNIDIKIDLVGNPTILTLGGAITNISVGYTGTDYRFYG